jgi:D-beta-D-heptose 7-phosphate kinase/D-beta-D-heptose 1-phosphate adenosyltransferase
MASDLSDLVRHLGRPRVLVVGDIILDRYIFGCAERISQEAPVPVLRADRHEDRLGGAASVASMLACLGAEVVLAGVVGGDAQSPCVEGLLRHFGVRADLVLPDPGRPTTFKQRYIGRAQDRHPQQILRVDFEVRTPLSASLETGLINGIDAHLSGCDIVLVSDYDKGVCTPRLLRHLIDRARAFQVKVLVDPIRGSDYSRYHGATCLTPNRTEAQFASGLPIGDSGDALQAGERLREQLDAEALVVTLDRDGMALAHRDGRRLVFPTRSRQVYDITGAGDMVLSVLGLCLAAGADYESAIALGNVAGGLEVERLGVATLTRDDLLHDLAVSAPQPGKVLSPAALAAELDLRRREGERIVFTNGCFDVLHQGHVRYLQQARALGQVLVVGLNSDGSVRRLKGPTRPLNPVPARAEVLAALACVDYVTVFEEDSPERLIENVRPHVLVKGGDYRPEKVAGREFVEGQGGQVVLLPLVPGQSTTRLVPHVQRSYVPESGPDDPGWTAATEVAPLVTPGVPLH